MRPQVGRVIRGERGWDVYGGVSMGRMAMVLLACWLGTGCSSLMAVRDPSPLPSTGNLQVTEQAILDALPRRRWTPEAVEPGRVVAFFAKGNYLLRVNITHNANVVQIQYLDSENLGHIEKEGQTYVHKVHTKWIRVLHRELAKALRQAASQTIVAPPVMQPPPPVQQAPAQAAPAG